MIKIKKEEFLQRSNGPRSDLYDIGDGRQWWSDFKRKLSNYDDSIDKEVKSFVFALPRELGFIIYSRRESPQDALAALSSILKNDQSYEVDMSKERAFKYFRHLILAANEKKVYRCGEKTLCGFLGVNLPKRDIDIIRIAEFTKYKIEKALRAIGAILEEEKISFVVKEEFRRAAKISFSEDAKAEKSV